MYINVLLDPIIHTWLEMSKYAALLHAESITPILIINDSNLTSGFREIHTEYTS